MSRSEYRGEDYSLPEENPLKQVSEAGKYYEVLFEETAPFCSPRLSKFVSPPLPTNKKYMLQIFPIMHISARGLEAARDILAEAPCLYLLLEFSAVSFPLPFSHYCTTQLGQCSNSPCYSTWRWSRKKAVFKMCKISWPHWGNLGQIWIITR